MSEQPPADRDAQVVTVPLDREAPEPTAAESFEADEMAPAAWERAVQRVFRRPMDWLDRPWPTERLVQYFTALIVLLGCTVATVKVVHLDLVFADNTPTGGDMGAHVMAPAYLRDHLLPKWQITGWSNYWYNGFPLYRFYMVVPALMIVALNIVFPYGVAFKIVVILGIVTLPWCCWAFGRLAKFRYPIPELMALAGLIFLFDESFSIYGGNVKSTMAGEFSFSIALSFAILGLGFLAKGLETGKYRSWTIVLLSLAVLCHGIVAVFVALACFLMLLVWMDRTRWTYGWTVGLGIFLLTAFWIIPFVFNHQYMTDMKYGYRPRGGGDSFWDMFFPWTSFLDLVVTGFAIVGLIASVIKRQLTGAWLGIMCIALMAATYIARDSLPVIGLLWNPRVLPFLYILRLMLMMVGIVATVEFFARGILGRSPRGDAQWFLGAATAGVVCLVVLVCQLFLFREMPGAETKVKDGKAVYSWGLAGWDPISLTPTSTDALSDGWTRYNFNGYEGRPFYAEYRALVDTMKDLGNTNGCGRALWENNGANGQYGTTMALMLLPHWTDGCVTSSEGLFFEASGTTPYHFLTAAAMSENSSNPVRELRYTDNNASIGVPMLQKMGIRYVMVFTQPAKDQASTSGDLKIVAQSGPWIVYEVANSDLVVPLTVQPVVVNHRDGDQRERHLELGTSWFQNTEEWAALPADDGPDEWQRIDVDVDISRRQLVPKQVDIVVPSETIDVEELPDITVSNVVLGDQDLSFDVSEVGVPVLVKMSYFPNWQVDGADGPYRVAPNFMVIIPTDTHVRLHYEASKLDRVSYLLTLGGIVFLVFLRRRGDVRHANAHPFLVEPSAPSAAGLEWNSYGWDVAPEWDPGGGGPPTPPDAPDTPESNGWRAGPPGSV